MGNFLKKIGYLLTSALLLLLIIISVKAFKIYLPIPLFVVFQWVLSAVGFFIGIFILACIWSIFSPKKNDIAEIVGWFKHEIILPIWNHNGKIIYLILMVFVAFFVWGINLIFQ